MEELSFDIIPILKQDDVQEGVVRLVQYDLILNDYTAWIDHYSQKVIIPRKELELHEIKGNLTPYVGTKLQFVLTAYDEKRHVYFGSCKAIKLKKREEIITRLKNGEVFDAKISRLVYFGAYLTIEGISVIIRNRDFASDYTTVADVYNQGDYISVKHLKVSQNGKINVEAIKKYENRSTIDIEDFKPHTVVCGVVRNVKSWACFVNIAPNLDAICPVPSYLMLKEGMKVAFRINQVRPEDGRVRGKIIKVIESNE